MFPVDSVCPQCGSYIWSKKDAIRLFDQNYHRECLQFALERTNIHLELVAAGLDRMLGQGQEEDPKAA